VVFEHVQFFFKAFIKFAELAKGARPVSTIKDSLCKFEENENNEILVLEFKSFNLFRYKKMRQKKAKINQYIRETGSRPLSFRLAKFHIGKKIKADKMGGRGMRKATI
jgi:hypothetical protein